ncbi:preprotein translocase subunit SecG [Rickettsiales endosymbiont of Peranema trichophorum]|uniref:preprotein translocase subunit SecG n=1 Tax=Rickettsiales endosymbiont of Peranema trichophorum TaxID=2486577 RepID=UPI0013EE52D1|nr:preprotein translocase subunit SecG [Rickettsiales endosymbiont of Peranema trichophorum]
MATTLLILQICIVLSLVCVILLQKTGADGLSGLSGGGHNFLSGKVIGQAFSRFTMFLAAAFIVNSLVLAKLAIVERQRAAYLVERIAIDQAKTQAGEDISKSAAVPIAK